jgi:hypothetical protein
MKRTPLLRRTQLKRTALERKSALVTRKPLARVSFKRKDRRPKPGDNPAFKRFVKQMPCAVGGWKCHEVDPHHIINGKGSDRKGMGQTAVDRNAFALCRRHHEEFHDRRGFSKGWDDAQRLTFQEQEIERLNRIWDDHTELGVWQEPLARAV